MGRHPWATTAQEASPGTRWALHHEGRRDHGHRGLAGRRVGALVWLEWACVGVGASPRDGLTGRVLVHLVVRYVAIMAETRPDAISAQ